MYKPKTQRWNKKFVVIKDSFDFNLLALSDNDYGWDKRETSKNYFVLATCQSVFA